MEQKMEQNSQPQHQGPDQKQEVDGKDCHGHAPMHREPAVNVGSKRSRQDSSSGDNSKRAVLKSPTTHIGKEMPQQQRAPGRRPSETIQDRRTTTALRRGRMNRVWINEDYESAVRTERANARSYTRLTVASYNVLAQNLLEDNLSLYSHCNRDFLNWEYRCRNLLKEILMASPDIICLQEIYHEHFKNHFRPMLEKNGYSGVYKKRNGDKLDGCATFFRHDKLTAVRTAPVNYYRPGTSVLNRDNVGLLVVLRHRDSTQQKSHICVANTHLLFNPRRGDIKLAQLMVLLAEIDKLAFKRRYDCPQYMPVILCGDFNSEPESAIVEFIKSGRLEYEGLLVRGISGQEEGRCRGRDVTLPRAFLPPHVGITDRCQYVATFHQHVTSDGNAILKRNCINAASPTVAPSSDCGVGFRISEATTREEGKEQSESTPSATEQTQTPPSGASAAAMATKNNCHGSSNVTTQNNDSQAVLPISPLGESRSVHPQSSSPNSCSSGSQLNEHSEGTVIGAAKHPEDTHQLHAAYLQQSSGIVSHNYNFRSVYNHTIMPPNRHGKVKTEVTTSHGRANCTVDYIFYSRRGNLFPGDSKANKCSRDRLILVSKLQLLTDQEMWNSGGLPNSDVSSDHLMLMAQFLWRYR